MLRVGSVQLDASVGRKACLQEVTQPFLEPTAKSEMLQLGHEPGSTLLVTSGLYRVFGILTEELPCYMCIYTYTYL